LRSNTPPVELVQGRVTLGDLLEVGFSASLPTSFDIFLHRLIVDQAGPVSIGEVLQLDDQQCVGPYSLQLDLLVPLSKGYLFE